MLIFSEFSNGLSNAFKLENGVTISTKRRSFLSLIFACLCLQETFAYEDSSKTFAKSFDSFAILSLRNDPLGKARLF